MENGVQIIKEYLEESLRLTISEDIEYGLYDENSKDITHVNKNKWHEKLLGYFMLTFSLYFGVPYISYCFHFSYCLIYTAYI